ncbi:MAG: 50S ribosomal protein L4 [Bacteroidia bacterium]
MELEVLNINGESTGRKVELSSDVFGIEPNDHAIYLDVKRYQAALRQGTHKSKERAEITGSTKKLKRQKGTGTARAGSIKSPLFKGGGRVFGPRPRNYDLKVNKKVRELARKSALTYKAKEQAIFVVEDFNFENPKTKEYVAFLKNMSLEDKKALHLRNEDFDNVWLSSRNLKKVLVQKASNVNTYEILNHQVLVLSESVVESFTNNSNN